MLEIYGLFRFMTEGLSPNNVPYFFNEALETL